MEIIQNPIGSITQIGSPNPWSNIFLICRTFTQEEVIRQSREIEKEIEERVAEQQKPMEMRMEAMETLMEKFSHLLGTEEHKVLVGDELPPFESVREDD